MTDADTNPEPRWQAAAYRILDANLNRSLEGLRVIEEYLRFVLEDAHLAAHCKQLRHDLAESTGQAVSRLHQSRDVYGDVGTSIGTSSEYQRVDLASVVVANMKRVEQALRSLEEYAKVVSPDWAPVMESLRYRAYTLERAITVSNMSLERLADARLYVLLDGQASLETFRQLVARLLDGGVDLLQLRDKKLPDRSLLERARALRELTHESKVLFIMNDRVDLAVLAGADGVHVGQEELPVRETRRLIGPEALIGVSTHDIEQARRAVLEGANYIGCGPTFSSVTKSFQQYAGVQFLRQVHREIRLPAFAIGGIDEQNVARVCELGWFRVAVSHSVVSKSDPAQAVRDLRAHIDQCEFAGAREPLPRRR